jgi:hypothetical protein
MDVVESSNDGILDKLLVGASNVGGVGIVKSNGEDVVELFHAVISLDSEKSRIITIDLDYNVCNLGEIRRATASENLVQFNLPLGVSGLGHVGTEHHIVVSTHAAVVSLPPP